MVTTDDIVLIWPSAGTCQPIVVTTNPIILGGVEHVVAVVDSDPLELSCSCGWDTTVLLNPATATEDVKEAIVEHLNA